MKSKRADRGRHFGISTTHGSTIVDLDHIDGKYRFTTESMGHLPRAHFRNAPKALAQIRETSGRRINGRSKGRVIYCVDCERNEVLAALAYHIPRDRRDPLLVIALAIRTEPAGLAGESFAMVYLTKLYVHALARRLNRHSYVDFVADDRTIGVDLGMLGFVPPADLARDDVEWRFRQFEP